MKKRRTAHKPAGEIQPVEHSEETKQMPKGKVSEGDRVQFTQSHDKMHTFTGTVVRVHDDSDLVDISVEPDGKAIEVETVMTANAAEVTPVDEAA